jgi:selenocysteine lyase/cysteine desulfurase
VLNAGSFGTYPKSVRTALHHFQDLAEARPDRFIRWDFQTHLRKSRALIAELLHAPYETCVFVPNATTGVNIILRNLVFEQGDVIVNFATIYGACENTVDYVCDTTKLASARVKYTLPIEDDELVQRFRDVVEKEQKEGKRVRIAMFDTVTSNPGARMPFERLTEVCRELGVMSLIDGAHGVGQVELNLAELDPDFFVSNCHK